jgi:hypothetical protein
MMRQNPGAWRREIAPYIPAGFIGYTPAVAASQTPPKR